MFLENVDRLIKSPAKQKGRDFGIMLKCLDDLGYAVECVLLMQPIIDFHNEEEYIYWHIKKKLFFLKIA